MVESKYCLHGGFNNMQEFTKQFFIDMPREQFYLWIKEHYEMLIGSAIFTKSNKLGSRLVSFAQKIHDKQKSEFVPSHTASIIEQNGMLYSFDMKPPRASIQSLTRYLLSTNDDYILVLRNFPLDTFMFSKNVGYHVGEFYAYFSALRSVFTKRQTKWVTHCSELHARMIALQGYQFPKDFDLECTPNELLMAFRNDMGDIINEL